MPDSISRCAARVVSSRPLLRVSQLPTPYRGASTGRVAPVSQYNPAAKPPSCHDTIYCIATHSPNSQALAYAPLRAGRPCRSLAGRIVAHAGRIVACHCTPLLVHSAVSRLLVRPGHACYDTTQCIVTQPPNGQ